MKGEIRGWKEGKEEERREGRREGEGRQMKVKEGVKEGEGTRGGGGRNLTSQKIMRNGT